MNWTWRWYQAANPSRGVRAHLFAKGEGWSFCGYAPAVRALDDAINPARRRCQACRTGQRNAATRRAGAAAEVG